MQYKVNSTRGEKMKKEKKQEENCKHAWLPTAFTRNTQVFGFAEKDKADVFLEGGGIAFMVCAECGENGWVYLEEFLTQ